MAVINALDEQTYQTRAYAEPVQSYAWLAKHWLDKQ
jgi:hypothetical protein